jgi:phosphatidylserine/phosphatidylglycerophosphate/cardiolipin synthase-like enzyme
MRSRVEHGGLTVQAVGGSNTVLLGFDLADPSDCLGFALHRTDHTEDEAYWLRGKKTFASVEPDPPDSADFSLRVHPVQGFQWGDYSAKPEHDYTYRVEALGGKPAQLTTLVSVDVDVRTEPEDDGVHGIWFNRGVAGSQAFVHKFGHYAPPRNGPEDHPAFAWLSRGLGEAFLRVVRSATDSRWGLRGAFYEFTWRTALREFADARDRGIDVALVVHGRDKDPEGGGDDDDRTAAESREAVEEVGIEDLIIWRTAPNKGALQHNKFLVLTHDDTPVAVWTGSTNLTQGAVFWHSNVGHLIHAAATATEFLEYWNQLADDDIATTNLRDWTEAANPAAQPVPADGGLTAVFSPRATDSTVLDWYAQLFDSAESSAHITGAFGLNAVFRDRLATDRDIPRTVLLDKWPKKGQEIPRDDPDVRISTGAYLRTAALDQWATERLTGFNPRVRFIHTKIILIDPLTDSPTVITGSANYSDNSTHTNEENTVVIRPNRDAQIPQRVADIYLTEYHRLFMHFVFRDWAERNAEPGTSSRPLHLTETPKWSSNYYDPNHWRSRQRRLFAGTRP